MEYNVEIAVGKRFYTSRNLLLLTKNEVELITKMPKTSLSRIENGILPSNPKWTDVLSNLYQISKADIYNVEKPLPDWKTLKRRVLAAHKNNLNLVIALEKKPKPKIAIQYRVLKSDFLNDFKTASKLTEHLKRKYNWAYKQASIKNALESLVEEKLLEIKGSNIVPQGFRKDRNISSDQQEIIDQLKTYFEETISQKFRDLVTPAFDKIAKMLFFLRTGPKKRSEIFKYSNYENATNNYNRSLKILIHLNFIEMTVKNKPNSSNQKYKLSEKGIAVLNKFNIKTSPI